MRRRWRTLASGIMLLGVGGCLVGLPDQLSQASADAQVALNQVCSVADALASQFGFDSPCTNGD